MALPVWPLDLPQAPERRSWTGGPRESRASFDPEVGPPLARPRTTADTWIWSATFPSLSRAQLESFRTFWRSSLRRGALPFQWTDPVYLDVGRWMIATDGEQPFTVASRGGGLFDLSLKLIRMPG